VYTDPAERLGEEAQQLLGDLKLSIPVTVAKDFMVLRGDRNFEPELQLAVKRLPWHRSSVPVAGGSTCACCG